MSSTHCLKITVLGGSSPFTAGLIDALVQSETRSAKIKPPPTIVLHGRSTKTLSLVGRYASHWLGPLDWNVQCTVDLHQALDGADIVIHQIRYGDLSGRADGERLCAEIGLAADETLGPAALLTAIRTLPDLKRTCDAINDHCPGARVLNLTNPLSAMTWFMTEMGVRHCVGLCELPLVTSLQAGRILDIDPAEQPQLQWTYTGLNHRGFIDTLEFEGRSVLGELVETLRSNSQFIGGVDAEVVADLHAIPLKYFRLVCSADSVGTRDSTGAPSGRAQQLQELRGRVTSELRESVTSSPPSLCERYMDWYPRSVVPLLGALCQGQVTEQMVNMRNGDGLVEEVAAKVHSGKWVADFRSSSNRKVRDWNDQFKVHERAFLTAMLEPSTENVRAVFEADPIIHRSVSEQAAQTFIRYRNRSLR